MELKYQYRKMSKREFINMIEKEYSDDVEFDVHILDFDANEKISMISHVDKKGINCIAKESKCIIYSGNKLMSYVDIHSVNQNIYDIKPKGIMKTILLEGI